MKDKQDPIDLLIQFLEIERDYIDKIIYNKPKKDKKYLEKRRSLMNNIIVISKELKTSEGIVKMKDHLEKKNNKRLG